MNEQTRTELELLSRWYDRVRSSTLRLLHDLAEEELNWQPTPRSHSGGRILAHIAVTEELRIQRRLAGRKVVPDSVVEAYRSGASLEHSQECPLAKDELELLLKNLRRATQAFLRGLILGRLQPRKPDVMEQLEKLVFQESQHLGQVRYLRMLRSAESSAVGGRPRESGSQGHEV